MRISRTRRWAAAIISIAAIYLLLMIPSPSLRPAAGGEASPFVWDRDSYWSSLETGFVQARAMGCGVLDATVAGELSTLSLLATRLETDSMDSGHPALDTLQTVLFESAPLLAACPSRFSEYVSTFGRIRRALKVQSRHWDISSSSTRARLYRLLYGGRTAIEEIMIQAPEFAVRDVVIETEEPSVTPSATIQGVTIHSGDILVSRGGAPTSALIARGNDYPGNFSHIALVHVDDVTGHVSIIESHIEKGVAVATVDEYLRDKKLRVMVLRLRADLSQMQSDPMLPHRAATFALYRATSERIPYDFAMNVTEPSKLFCSEVAYDAYRSCGISLWSALSHISQIGARTWLAAFGVENFTTQEPSDLEYDPQIRVVAEWRDYETLYQDRLDNAVVDVMLEAADSGAVLAYESSKLPLARLAKAYSWLLNRFGAVGPIPEGMSATSALQNEWFSKRHHATRDHLSMMAGQFRQDRGYAPPYWELVRMARDAYWAANE